MESSNIESIGMPNINTSVSREHNHLANLAYYIEYEKDVSGICVKLFLEMLNTIGRNKSQLSSYSCFQAYDEFRNTLYSDQDDLKKKEINLQYIKSVEDFDIIFKNLEECIDTNKYQEKSDFIMNNTNSDRIILNKKKDEIFRLLEDSKNTNENEPKDLILEMAKEDSKKREVYYKSLNTSYSINSKNYKDSINQIKILSKKLLNFMSNNSVYINQNENFKENLLKGTKNDDMENLEKNNFREENINLKCSEEKDLKKLLDNNTNIIESELKKNQDLDKISENLKNKKIKNEENINIDLDINLNTNNKIGNELNLENNFNKNFEKKIGENIENIFENDDENNFDNNITKKNEDNDENFIQKKIDYQVKDNILGNFKNKSSDEILDKLTIIEKILKQTQLKKNLIQSSQKENNLLEKEFQNLNQEKLEKKPKEKKKSNFLKQIFNNLKFSKEDFIQLEKESNGDNIEILINKLLAIKLSEYINTGNYQNITITKKLFKNFYNCVSVIYKQGFSFLAFLIRFLRYYNFQEKKEELQNKISPFIKNDTENFSKFAEDIKLEMEEFFLDLNEIEKRSDKCKILIDEKFKSNEKLIDDLEDILCNFNSSMTNSMTKKN